jgi:hypothetical protein
LHPFTQVRSLADMPTVFVDKAVKSDSSAENFDVEDIGELHVFLFIYLNVSLEALVSSRC